MRSLPAQWKYEPMTKDTEQTGPQSAARLSILLFGIATTAMGVTAVVFPRLISTILGIESSHSPLMLPVGVAATAMGAYYIEAARAHLVQFYHWTVRLRLFNTAVFSVAIIVGQFPPNFWMLAGWELVGALTTAVLLRQDNS